VSGIVVAFVSLISVAVLGYLAGLARVLRPQDEAVLSRLTFFVATPALLFTTIATADLSSIISPVLVTAVVSVIVVQAVYTVAARLLWRRPRAETTIGALTASYVNSGNLGIPISVYVLGDGALVAPILLFQLVVLAPAAFLILDPGSGPGDSARRSEPGRRSVWRTASGTALGTVLGTVWAVLRRPLRNPITVASLIGLAVALGGLDVPDPVMRPISLVSDAAVPVALLAYGLSLSGARARRGGRAPRPGDGAPRPGEAAGDGRAESTGRRDVVLAVVLKCLVQPLVAYLTGTVLLDLTGTMLLAATLFAALPTAQNIYVFATHYRSATRMARTTLLVTTALSIPIMIAITGLLG